MTAKISGKVYWKGRKEDVAWTNSLAHIEK